MVAERLSVGAQLHPVDRRDSPRTDQVLAELLVAIYEECGEPAAYLPCQSGAVSEQEQVVFIVLDLAPF